MQNRLGSLSKSPLVLGCSGGGIIGNGLEVEQRAALSITAASLPEVTLDAFHLEGDQLPDLDAGPQAWESLLQVNAADAPQFVVLADPFSFPVQNLLLGLDFAYAPAAKIGGLASGGQQQEGNALFLGDRVHHSGAVGVALHGNIAVDTVVAQGCRPIGKPMRITQSRRNLLEGLDSETPLNVLRELFPTLSQRDQGLMRNSLFLGVVMDEFIDAPQQGDFLIRNVMGMDERSGALAIGEMLKEGQLVQFHLRDAETSAQDLTAVLGTLRRGQPGEPDSRGLALFLPGPGPVPLRPAQPRHRHFPGQAGRGAVGRLLLQRGNWPGQRRNLPARLHQFLRNFPPPVLNRSGGAGDFHYGIIINVGAGL